MIISCPKRPKRTPHGEFAGGDTPACKLPITISLVPLAQVGLGMTTRDDNHRHGEYREQNGSDADNALQANSGASNQAHQANSLREQVHAAAQAGCHYPTTAMRQGKAKVTQICH